MANSDVSPSSLDCTRGTALLTSFNRPRLHRSVKDIQKISARFGTQFEVGKDDGRDSGRSELTRSGIRKFQTVQCMVAQTNL